MAAETQTLNFGPEWLRALSSGGSVASPPPSPALPKYKLADYRYGREEMLALYMKDNKVPEELADKEFLAILQDEPLLPLALVPLTEEEQRNFSMSVNSSAVMRLMGRGGGAPPAGVVRGRGGARGRGRGRGESGYYQRSFEDGEGGFSRGAREMLRSQSWEERGDRRFEKPGRRDGVRVGFEEVTPTSRKQDFARSDSENWRAIREEQNGEDEDGGWRTAGARREGDRWRPPSPDGPRSAGWRDHTDQQRRRRFDFDFRERDEDRSYRRGRTGSGSYEDEKDNLPEWCLEDAEEEMGTFDSSGAFMSLKKGSKEPIPEEQELEFRGVDELDERPENEYDMEFYKESDRTENGDADRTDLPSEAYNGKTSPSCSSSSPSESQPQEVFLPVPEECEAVVHRAETELTDSVSDTQGHNKPVDEAVNLGQPAQLSPATVSTLSSSSPSSSPPYPGTAAEFIPADNDDDEGMKRFEQEAEKMVASLHDNSLDDERFVEMMQDQRSRAAAAALPLSHEAAMKWFYKDPQGEIQGPFTTQEMADWFQAGYFPMSLLVKRGCDEGFQPLGDVIKMWGRVPFAPGPSPPPLLPNPNSTDVVRTHQGDMDQGRLKKQRELAAALYHQLQYQQFLQLINSRQQLLQCALQQKANMTPQQQQQLMLFLQQIQNLKSRCAEQNLIPPINRSVSVPETGSLWDLPASASQPSGCEAGSLWDSASQGPLLEQIQKLEREKATKLKQERRDVELRNKREEDDRKRQDEIRWQEEERKRRDEDELTRRKQEEVVRFQREQQEEAARRQREEEDRRQEEALRRRDEEERRQMEDILRKQEKDRRWMEEEESRRQLEEEARRRLAEEEERKRKEMDLQLQRQQEMLRHRQQQEALRRLQQQQLAHIKIPSSTTWGQQSNSVPPLQKLEEERERQRREEQCRQQQEIMKVLQQHQQKSPGWNSIPKQSMSVKSLLEMQQELQKQQQQRAQARAHSGIPINSSSVWGLPGQWGSDMNNMWSVHETKNSNISLWGDEAVKSTGPVIRNAGLKNSRSSPSLSDSYGIPTRPSKKKTEDEEKLLKLFQGMNKTQDGFTQWCEQMLHVLNTANNLDVPTFVSFLKEVDSPYEVHDYIRAYLGDTPEAKEFAKQFLDRRAKQKANQQRQQQQQLTKELLGLTGNLSLQPDRLQDSIWGISSNSLQSLFQANHNSAQQSSYESSQAGKKKKKQKMVRADPSILGFSVNASSERLNMGEIETMDDF
ncbi:GRB10-interacting GYF protein 2-like isoform X5 [Pristis pectinata]|nr:GRB10-interacting GYF protein 2-like isoform X5 [Pristis pectinata]XP_051900413.1 GRB10-interacting GYF protein 2-like isoform X5 [Pristis pectinata]XP_051900414.1 GRB10-interacting GYF protein 2-like isoform X5 [Pristis pectinata]XP_051900415.1 GRB10-interacting GYF protein 2-like isoform X5 [Pristis pectinata]XP_051900416.1 GRB10-interacting GYF protein 2-like isoform X5 [Pristis pectinata]XP_051900417.1 GRB10-interacting GYF protein 2-like isoform X5 [Pristis pectinata]XP_051900418.1 GR